MESNLNKGKVVRGLYRPQRRLHGVFCSRGGLLRIVVRQRVPQVNLVSVFHIPK